MTSIFWYILKIELLQIWAIAKDSCQSFKVFLFRRSSFMFLCIKLVFCQFLVDTNLLKNVDKKIYIWDSSSNFRNPTGKWSACLSNLKTWRVVPLLRKSRNLYSRSCETSCRWLNRCKEAANRFWTKCQIWWRNSRITAMKWGVCAKRRSRLHQHNRWLPWIRTPCIRWPVCMYWPGILLTISNPFAKERKLVTRCIIRLYLIVQFFLNCAGRGDFVTRFHRKGNS